MPSFNSGEVGGGGGGRDDTHIKIFCLEPGKLCGLSILSYPKIQQSCNVRTGLDKSIKKYVRRMDHQQKNDKTEKSKRTRQKNKRGERKGESNDSPEGSSQG